MQEETIGGYTNRQKKYKEEYEATGRSHYRLGLARLVVLLASAATFYLYYRDDTWRYLVAGVALAAVFVVLVRIQQQVHRKKLLAQELMRINEEEAGYLREGMLPFADGSRFKDPGHAYAADLDIFGDRSLYQHLNRTDTEMGGNALAQALLKRQEAAAIPQRQQAVAEMSGHLDIRQRLYATARITPDSDDSYRRLMRWAAAEEAPLSIVLRILAYVLPAVLGVFIIMYVATGADIWWSLITYIVPVNVAVFFIALKRIKRAIAGTDPVQKTLVSYAELLRQIEDAPFTAPYLKGLQERLIYNGSKASTHLQQLARIYASMENVQNPFAAMGMNGLYLHHIHMLHKLIVWKKAYAAQIELWLSMIGEMEVLGSLANQHFNNPSFCFPELNENAVVAFTELGHPLIPARKRVCSNISFAGQRFVVLTGSNMSGKSTFLRTLGVNIVLAGAGGVVCAATAKLQSMDLHVSMRQSDSLADNESYFFAEVKRLQHIISRLSDGPCFVLLDEILRGTNSDDKRSGTVGVIEKIIRTRAIGAIATHDLEVCLTTDEHPDVLVNKCFEVETESDELVFDYKLRDGICRNKSATFIMKKMKIID
jgi:ABC-type multidrug transport system fused ATPase/permease subunit